MAKDLKPIADLGSTGQTVRDNIRRLREWLNLTYAELSRRLAEVQRPIPTLGLRRIEAGARRVDVDDLVALAIVLNVTPNVLLLPRGEQNDPVEVTGAGEMSVGTAWAWAHAEESVRGDLLPIQTTMWLPAWRRTVPIPATTEGRAVRSRRVPEEDVRKFLEPYEQRIRALEERLSGGDDGDD